MPHKNTQSTQKNTRSVRLKRHLSRVDRWLEQLDHARLTLSNALPQHRPRPEPSAEDLESQPHANHLSPGDRHDIAGCLRVNHSGEVCAQALYLGQATQAESTCVKAHLLASAKEEEAHLQWCAERLEELDAKPSLLNPLWYALSFGLGVAVAKLSDQISLGFINATENQVKHHLEAHIARIPPQDITTLAILGQMLTEEIAHADAALEHGGKAFPGWIQSLMWLSSRLMTTASHRI
jgi:ubiquinone biosynthesis monooxygenase Coq7